MGDIFAQWWYFTSTWPGQCILLLISASSWLGFRNEQLACKINAPPSAAWQYLLVIVASALQPLNTADAVPPACADADWLIDDRTALSRDHHSHLEPPSATSKRFFSFITPDFKHYNSDDIPQVMAYLPPKIRSMLLILPAAYIRWHINDITMKQTFVISPHLSRSSDIIGQLRNLLLWDFFYFASASVGHRDASSTAFSSSFLLRFAMLRMAIEFYWQSERPSRNNFDIYAVSFKPRHLRTPLLDVALFHYDIFALGLLSSFICSLLSSIAKRHFGTLYFGEYFSRSRKHNIH